MLRRAAGSRDERGASFVEYVAMGALAVLVLAGLIPGVGTALATGTARTTSCVTLGRAACAARTGTVHTAGTVPKDAPRKGTPPKAAPHKGGCHGFWGCTWHGTKNVAGGVRGAVSDNVSGLRRLVTTNPVTTGKGAVSYLWSKTGGAAITATRACTSGDWMTCAVSGQCVLSGAQCVVTDMVFDPKTTEDLGEHRWGDASGRVLWNAGSLLIPTKTAGANRIEDLDRAGEGVRAPLGGERAPGAFEKARRALQGLRRDGSSTSEMFLLHGGDLARTFLALDPAERTRFLDTMTRGELRAFYRDAGGFDPNLPSDLLQAASRDALAEIRPAEPAFAGSGGWRPFTGDLFDGSFPNARDIAQGRLGDCWCLAPSQSIAGMPRGGLDLKDMFTKNPNGTYTVAFGDGRRVTVTPTLPVNGAHVTDAGWPAILEKAMAVRTEGGYDVLTKASNPSRSMRWLTGKEVEEYRGGYDMPRAATVKKWFDDQNPLVLSFPEAKYMTIPKYLDRGIVARHAYSVRYVDPYTGIITLANPHGPDSALVTISEKELMLTPGLRLYRGRLPERSPVDDDGPFWPDD